MSIINLLVKKNLLLNKQRSIVTIVGIILSCALITALITLFTSFQETLITDAYDSYGNRHVTFYDVSQEDLSVIENNKYVESFYTTANLTAKDLEDEMIGVIALDDKASLDLENCLYAGDIPHNEDEIVLDYRYALNESICVGDYITIDLGERYSLDGYLLNGGNTVTEEEYFVTTTTKTYKVAGLALYGTFLVDDILPNNAYILGDSDGSNVNVYVYYNQISKYAEISELIVNETDISSYSYNLEALRWSGYASSDNTLETFYCLVGIVSSIIIATSVFCIRNSFAISRVEKTRMYGMLSSVGATPKQIKRSILKEGFYLGIIGIPMGLVFGNLAAYILALLVNLLLESSVKFIYSVSLVGIIISTLLAIITIYLSAIGNARKASKITEIEAIKNSDTMKIKDHNMKVPLLIKKLFGISGVFAYKNMKRNKSKFRVTVISLVVSIATFLSLSYFIQVGFDIIYEGYKSNTYNLSLVIDYSVDEQYELCHTMTKDLDIENSIIYNYTYQLIDNGKHSEEEYTEVHLLSISENEYQEVVESLGYDMDEVKEKGIVIRNEISYYNEETEEVYDEVIIDEDTKEINICDYAGNFLQSMEIVYGTEATFMASEELYSGQLVVLVSNKYYNSLVTTENYVVYYCQSDDADNLQKSMNDWLTGKDIDGEITNYQAFIDSQNNSILLMSIFLYGFITVIILIGLTNIFNTLTTNMKLRDREFAILKSIGMTDRELKGMIRLESIFYGGKSLFWGLLYGIGLSYIIYLALMRQDYIRETILSKFRMPNYALVITVLFVFIVIYLIMSYSLSKIKKQNLIETIKKENI